MWIRQDANSYEQQFAQTCKDLAKQDKKAVSHKVVEIFDWILMDMRSLERALSVPSVKLALEQAEKIEQLSDQIERLYKEVNRLTDRLEHDDD